MDGLLRYFNGELVQEGDQVSIHFRSGEKASEGVVSGRAQENASLVQVIIGKDQEEFCAEDGEWYAPGAPLGSMFSPLKKTGSGGGEPSAYSEALAVVPL